jgi:hypothetical protein
MAKTVTFNENMIAKGYDNYSGLTNIELIPVGGKSAEDYLPRVNDLGIQYTRKVTGDGVVRRDGFVTTQWLAPYMSFAQRTYIKHNILDGNDSGKVTIKTRLDDVPFDDTMSEMYVITNAILTLPPLPDGDQYVYGLRQFSYDFSRIDMNSLLHEDAMIGELKLTGGSTAQSAITTTPVKLTGFDTAGINDKGVTVSASDDSLTAVVAADYQLFAELNFTATASTQWTFQFYVDGVAVGHKSIVSTNATPDPVHVVMLKPYRITATDVVTIYVNSDAGGGASLTLTEANFYISSI